MTRTDLLALRMRNHGLVDSSFRTPHDAVAHLGAVQSQDYPAASWAIGLRVPGLTAADVDAALNSGAIVRTHVLRPTWHFVSPADIRWMLALSGPRIRRSLGSYMKNRRLDPKCFMRSRRVIERTLAGGKARTRAEIAGALRRSGLPAAELAPAFQLIDAELEGLVCSGPRVGKERTYALLEERVPPAPAIDREEALARLARVYFRSHGPATMRDFIWWSGLVAKEARGAVAALGTSLQRVTVDGREFLFEPPSGSLARRRGATPLVHLLPAFDEYLVAYQDREELIVSPKAGAKFGGGDLLSPHLSVDGFVVGKWKRAAARNGVKVNIALAAPVDRHARRAIDQAAEAYGVFLQQSVTPNLT